MVKYVIFGNGWLGNKFKNYLGDDAILLREKIGQVMAFSEIRFFIREYKPEVIINCIGKTGRPNIDWCESHKEATFFSNVTIPAMTAEACKEAGTYMVHIGSGCIYEGDNDGYGYDEYSSPNYIGSFYSRTKIFADEILLNYTNDTDILNIRIRMPIDDRPSNRNLINKLVGYRQVIGDVKNSVTCVPDLLKVTKELMDRRCCGTTHIVNEGAITHREILEMYKEIVDPEYIMPEFITVDELNEITKTGRSNCVLVNDRLRELGIKIRNSHEAIRDCLTKYKDV